MLIGKDCRDCKWFGIYSDWCDFLKKDVKPWEDAKDCEYYYRINRLRGALTLFEVADLMNKKQE